MRFGSLFAGIGGLDLGLERAGMECVWQVEIDDYCTKILEKHWPDVRRYRDVRGVGSNLEPVDLIAGGFPCQPHSVAGKQLGEEDDRNLWPEFIRVIRETKPRYVLGENVSGIITTYLDTVLSDLEDAGYTPWPFTFSACGFDAPHRRERVFVVAYTIDRGPQERWPQSVGGMEGCGEGGQATSNNLSTVEKSGNVAHTDRTRTSQSQGSEREKRGWPINGGQKNEESYWHTEPNVGRVAHGIPSRVDRLRGLGNAVVPQVAEWIGRRIMEHNRHLIELEGN